MENILNKNNITSFSLSQEAFIENRKIIKNIFTNEVISEIEDASKLVHFKNEIIVLDSLNRAYKLNGKLFLKDRILDISNHYILTYSKSPQYYAIYNFDLNIIFYDLHNFGRNIFNDLIVDGIGDSTFITTRNIPRNKILSLFSLVLLGTWQDGATAKEFQVAEFAGIHNSTLVCTMNSGAVLLLNIETGELKNFFKDAKVRGGIYQKEENSSIFLGLKHYTFIEINAETGQLLKQIDIQHELKKVANIPDKSPCWLTVGTSIFQDGLFYFYGDKNFVGVFDPKTEKIIDHHWFEFETKGTQLKGGIENLQVKDDEIYCLDMANTLHILKPSYKR